jgi:hypothetical protein
MVPRPKAIKDIVIGAPVAGAAAALTFWQWIAEHPLTTVGIVLGGIAAIGGAVHALNRWHRQRQEAPSAGLVWISR